MSTEREELVLGRAYRPYLHFKSRLLELMNQAQNNGGKLPNHQWFRVNYYKNPYLILETDQNIEDRFRDIYINTIDLSPEGKIVPDPMMANNHRLAQLFTEVIEETNWRGNLTNDVVRSANAVVSGYFTERPPLGCRMFGDRTSLPGECLVKYSKAEYVRDMLKYGRFRISPASEYSKGSHIKAIRDYETRRSYYLPALNELIAKGDDFELIGVKGKIVNGFIPVDFVVDDYFLFSTCREIDRRMPTDFNSDAALIVKDRSQFLKRVKKAMLAYLPSWLFMAGEVYYYDPYNDIPKADDQEFRKHIAYSYQKEHRCVLRRHSINYAKLEPFFIEIGSLDDIAEAVYV